MLKKIGRILILVVAVLVGQLILRALAPRCQSFILATDADRAALTRSVDAMAAAGLRVLGVARASFVGQTWPDSPHDFAFSFLASIRGTERVRRITTCRGTPITTCAGRKCNFSRVAARAAPITARLD